MNVQTPPAWTMRWWRRVALVFAVISSLAALFLLLFGESLLAGAFGLSAIFVWLNYVSVRGASRALERRRERLDARRRS